ncbi:MAG: 2-succinyl-5-enolpyruvyl-6-hydroxy-3-cyclohexene-1-carboxylic-acid synthase [Cyanobium sp.]
MSPGPPFRLPSAEANVRAALVLLRGLLSLGLQHLVLCPGSRSAPLAVAAALLEPAGLQLHTAIDERSAAFFALGLGRASGLPAAVVTTSGSAVAHLLPAAVEADHGTVPLLLISADRPARLKGCGANQSVNQEEFLACSCRWFAQGPGEGLAVLAPAELERLAATAIDHCRGDGRRRPAGAVHLNLPFEEPLHIEAASLAALLAEMNAAAATGPAAHAPDAPAHAAGGFAAAEDAAAEPVDRPAGGFPLDPDRPGVVVAGPWRGEPARWSAHLQALRSWQRRSGWPVLADALSGLRGCDGLDLVGGYDLLLQDPAPDRLPRPAQVLRLGSLPASRSLERWLAAIGGRQCLVSEADPRRLDPLGLAIGQSAAGLPAWLERFPAPTLEGRPAAPSLALARRWHQLEAELQQRLDAFLPSDPLNEPVLARQLSRLLPPGVPLMLANSSPVRDWAAYADPAAPPRPVFGFRGASGIDGTLSIACGLAEALGQLVLVSGDLALLHDAAGWLWHGRLRGRLTVLLIDNGGGGIFEQLPIRCQSGELLDFERLFAMPQKLDPLALAAVHGVPGRRVAEAGQLAAALAWALEQPMALLRLVTDRRADAALRQRLRTMAADLRPNP